MLAHRIASRGARAGIDGLAAAMVVAAAVITPIGLGAAAPALTAPATLGAGIGVGVTSSVIPYVCDQMAMARLARAAHALMVSLLPAIAVIVGIVVLGQVPSTTDAAGVALVVASVACHDAGGQPG